MNDSFDLRSILVDAAKSCLVVDTSNILDEGVIVSKGWTNVDQVLPFAKLQKTLEEARIPFAITTGYESDVPKVCRLTIWCSPVVLVRT